MSAVRWSQLGWNLFNFQVENWNIGKLECENKQQTPSMCESLWNSQLFIEHTHLQRIHRCFKQTMNEEKSCKFWTKFTSSQKLEKRWLQGLSSWSWILSRGVGAMQSYIKTILNDIDRIQGPDKDKKRENVHWIAREWKFFVLSTLSWWSINFTDCMYSGIFYECKRVGEANERKKWRKVEMKMISRENRHDYPEMRKSIKRIRSVDDKNRQTLLTLQLIAGGSSNFSGAPLIQKTKFRFHTQLNSSKTHRALVHGRNFLITR